MPPLKCNACGSLLSDDQLMKPRSINIFLVDGHPNGTRIAQISMSTIQAIAFPRNQFTRVRKEFSELSRPGVYILYGPEESDSTSMAGYVGQSESVATRLAYHNSSKDGSGKSNKEFWSNTIVLISKDDNLTSAHARFVEGRLIVAAAKNPSWSIDKNKQQPDDAGVLPLSERVAMEEFIDQTKTLVGALGCDIFRVVIGQSSDHVGGAVTPEQLEESGGEVFRMNGHGYSATMVPTNTGEFIVHKESTARLKTTKSIPKSTTNLRTMLVNQGILAPGLDQLAFTSDYHFTSVSAAAATVVGGAANGRITWKLKDGRTYAEWESGETNEQEKALDE